MNIQFASVLTSNPASATFTFDSNLSKAIYQATWRFVAVDSGAQVVSIVDLPMTFTIN
jgi:hypothetical protein